MGSAKIVDGHATLSNDQVTYRWAKAEHGAGLISIYDRVNEKELLKTDSKSSSWWQIKFKSGKTIDNIGKPCEVRLSQGTISFIWDGQVRVEIHARLGDDDALLRSRISVQIKNQIDGLNTVTFPLINGLTPLTEDAKQDKLLVASHLGFLKPSPLSSGKPVSLRYNIQMNMQMAALIAPGQGIYFGEEDDQANVKTFSWTPDSKSNTLTFAISHPVLDFGGEKPVTAYAGSGDFVFGPFTGDWFDAAQIYRKWAVTAPWCRKGNISERDDYPKWFANSPYWVNGGSSDDEEIENQFKKHQFLGPQNSIVHDYYYMTHFYQHDRNPDMFPPRIGSIAYKKLVKQYHDLGIKVIPYIEGWLWNMSTESYRMEQGEKSAMTGNEEGSVLWTWAGGLDPQAAMCPATEQWRQKMIDISEQYVGTYSLDGVYFDYFSAHNNNCFNKEHGHAIGGGNFWTKSVHDLYEQVRKACKKINPQTVICAEDFTESCFDVVDAVYDIGFEFPVPISLAVYHGYTKVFGGTHNQVRPSFHGRKWLLGGNNGPHNTELSMVEPKNELYIQYGQHYRRLIACTRQFAQPYLGYGRMLRAPQLQSDLPTITLTPYFNYGPATLPTVDGTAWQAPDGTVGIFFLNYDSKKSFEFTWSLNLNEITEIGPDKQLKVTRWTEQDGEQPFAKWSGGKLTQTMTIEPWGMIALKLEVIQ